MDTTLTVVHTMRIFGLSFFTDRLSNRTKANRTRVGDANTYPFN